MHSYLTFIPTSYHLLYITAACFSLAFNLVKQNIHLCPWWKPFDERMNHIREIRNRFMELYESSRSVHHQQQQQKQSASNAAPHQEKHDMKHNATPPNPPMKSVPEEHCPRELAAAPSSATASKASSAPSHSAQHRSPTPSRCSMAVEEQKQETSFPAGEKRHSEASGETSAAVKKLKAEPAEEKEEGEI